jgi:hypothetical protein
MDKIDKYISEKKYTETMNECLRQNQYYIGLLIAYTLNNNDFIQQFSSCICKINLEKKQINENN